MAVVKTSPMKLLGPWGVGYVLDYHSVSATPTGDPYHPFEMKYTELGSRVYLFKYRGDEGSALCEAKWTEITTVTTFRINTCKSVSKQRTLTPFRMNTTN
jgi:hypothetical protein